MFWNIVFAIVAVFLIIAILPAGPAVMALLVLRFIDGLSLAIGRLRKVWKAPKIP